MSGQLERLLEEATEGRQDTTDVVVRAASRAVAEEKLGDLAPDLARLLVDAMAYLSFDHDRHGDECDGCALLARFADVEQRAGERQA